MLFSHAILGGKNFCEYEKQNIKNYVPAIFRAQNPILEPEKKERRKILHKLSLRKSFSLFSSVSRNVLGFMLKIFFI